MNDEPSPDRRREQLAELLRRRRDERRVRPVSFAQRRLWFLDQLLPDGRLYNICLGLRLRGPLDARVLASCLDEIVARHEVLRTTIEAADGEPNQRIANPRPMELELVDCGSVPRAEQEAEVRRSARDLGSRPIDLAKGPLMRGRLLELASDEHVLVIVVHHIAFDGWSSAILIGELSALYAARTAGRPSPLASLPIQYGDFADWQRERIGGEALAELLAYWSAKLASAPVLDLPTDHARPLVPRYSSERRSIDVDPDVVESLERLSRESGGTLFATVLAALKILLQRYSGQTDIVVGSPIAGRSRPETEKLIGCFVNSLVLRTDLSGDPTFRELLGRVRETVLGAFEHEALPFEKLVEALQPERDISRNPYFQVLFSFQGAADFQAPSRAGPGLGALDVRQVELDSGTTRLDVEVYAFRGPLGLRLMVNYRTDLFDSGTMERLLGHLAVLLRGIAGGPDRRISELPLLGEKERRHVLEAWNASEAAPLEIATVHGLVEKQIARTPDAVAVEFEGRRLTYAELGRRAREIARRLRALGIGRGDRIGVCLERGPDLVATLLGILEAGAAYVPLDPTHPAQRLAFILADAEVRALVTQGDLLERLELKSSAVAVLLLERDRASVAAGSEDGEISGAKVSAQDLAYVIYTSGSTGQPKGVEIAHGAVVNFLTSMQRRPGLRAEDVFLSVTTVTFDISVLEIFGPLIVGARVVLVPAAAAADALALEASLTQSRATVMQATPATWRMLLEAGWSGDRRLKILCGGEAWSRRLADELLARCGELWNMYGPTETTIWSAVQRVEAGAAPVSIGEPIANTKLHVLDARGAPQPLGVPGELCIGGAGLARGYWKRPELTSERFVRDPFEAREGARLYRTGDRARRLSDGTIEFLGRLDHQVKVQGFRIELGEIESVLAGDPRVREVVVVARELGPGDTRLIAYVVPGDGAAAPSSTELRDLLRERLPEYMVPSHFVHLESLPRTPSGKVDRRALPALDPTEAQRAVAYVPPTTSTEQRLAEIYGEVLGLERVGASDHFFELGGHSLLATQVVSRVRASFEVELALLELFEHPTVGALARRIEASRQRGAIAGALELEAAPADAPVELSFGQQRFWFLEQLQRGSAAFNVHVAWRLRGALDVEALRRALTEIVRRHAVLRTSFPEGEDGEPRCVVAAPAPFNLMQSDLSSLGEAEREAAVAEIGAEETRTPFDIATGPLLRVRLVRLTGAEHVWMLTIHHIVSDAWSVGIFWRELVALYSAFAAAQPSPLAELALQYSDVARWQRRWLSEERLSAQLEYWTRQLRGVPPLLELPTDRPRPALESFEGARASRRLGPELTRALKSLALREDATLFMVLLAGFQALLERYSGQDDIVVGSPIAGRTRSETEELIGLFVNSLVLRTDLSGDPSFRELLARVRAVSLGAFAHQELPFERLVQELRPPREMSHHPLFQVMLVLQNAPRTRDVLPGLELSAMGADRTSSQFDLTLFVWESGGELSVTAEYKTALFEESTIVRVLEHLDRLLAGAVADPARRISEVALLGAEERRHVLEAWNASEAAPPEIATVHGLVEKQIARTPQAVAVEFEGKRLTYAELGHRAREIARRLRALGIGRGDRVGVCLERGPDLVATLLGILEAGAAYVPLDPTHPAQRLAFILADAEVRALVTQGDLVARLELKSGAVAVLLLERDLASAAPGSENGELSGAPLSAEDLAYVIYTSGSTGQPKGVEIAHGAVVNFLASMQRRPGLRAEDVFLSVTTVTFDISVLEIFGPLSVGARVVLVPAAVAADGRQLDARLAQSRATVMQATPATWRMLLEAGWSGDRRLKILCGGEAWSRRLADELLVRCGELWNMYGPTETTIWSAVQRVEAGAAPVSIGEPIANTKLHVLDARGAPQPLGVPGELCIGGAGLARGYWKRPELTAERFVRDPFEAREGARLYRTGDRARRRADGTIEFLGRLDHQVKVQGFRIELGEIEAVLSGDARVSEAVVVARELGPGDTRLVAYVVGVPSASELRDLLRERLPEYMVPSHFVHLESFPRTPSGKVDRRALPALDPSEAQRAVAYVPPTSATEERLAEIYGEVLGIERVGAADHFFEMGGHSLLATRVASRVRASFEVELALLELFEHPTVAALARRIDALRQRGGMSGSEELSVAPADAPVELSFGQQRFWFLEQLQGGSAAFNVHVAWRVRGVLDVETLRRALTEIVRRHAVLRTSFPESEDGEPRCVLAASAPFDLALSDLSSLRETEREAAVREMDAAEWHTPFDIAKGPLLRVRLVRLTEAEHVWMLTIHHMVSDAWSVGIFWREMVALYSAFAAAQPSPLAELALQYSDVARWQRRWLAEERLAAQLEYWTKQLRGVPPLLELPTDHPRPALESFEGARCSRRLGAELTRALKSLALREDATLFMVLLAGFQALLERYSGQDDIVVGAPIAGRTRAETEELIGLFVNSLVLRTDLSGDPSFTELLARVRAVALGAFAHQELPFERLVQELRPPREMSHHPLFQVMLVLQNAPRTRDVLPGLELSPMGADRTSSQFDLTLFAWEAGGELALTAEYKTALFEESTIARLLEHLERLLAGAVAHPAQRISEVALLGEKERRQVLEAWNASGLSLPVERCVHELVEEQAVRTPQSLAVTMGRERWTYAELRESAGRLAGTLRSLGVGAGDRVGVFLDRSPTMVVALLGVLESGAAYVPLDPAHPAERIGFMLADAQVRALLTTTDLAARVRPVDATVLCLDAPERTETPGAAAISPARSAGPDDLAYVIYTSGSTGRPKGVEVSHRAVVNLLFSMRRAPGLAPEDVLLAITTLTFDISVLEIFLPLIVGARLEVVGRAEAADGLALKRRLEESGATVMQATPATWRMLLEAGWSGDRRLKILCGGEAWSRRLADELLVRCGELWNMYGPTETTIWSAVQRVEAGAAPVSIGEPIANTKLHVLDARGNPQPLGVPGELCIGGAGLARGYWKRPELTAERFVRDPFDAREGARLYRTGDRARRRADGTIEFLGRLDHQVKVQGFRIELGEIEAVLSGDPRVSEAVVVARELGPGDTRLVAYVVPGEGAAAPSSTELRDLLRERLPEYMVPSHFVHLESLPRTPSGKVDRRALPALDPTEAQRAVAYVPPTTSTEQRLAEIYGEVLGLERVGASDHFFELGGHSLLATQVVSRVRASFEVELALLELFEHPTVGALARRIEASRQRGAIAGALELEAAPADAPVELSFGQQRFWFLEQLQRGSAAFNVHVAWRLRGALDVEALRRALTEIVRRHAVLRTSFPEGEDGEPRCVVVAPAPFDLAQSDLSALGDAEREAAVRETDAAEWHTPFDIAKGPLLRVRLVRLTEAEHVWMLTIHHIVSDAWSVGIFWRELVALYSAFANAQPSPLAELSLQYSDVARWQRRWLSEERLAAQLEYWTRQLRGVPPLLELPTDRPRPALESFEGTRASRRLGPELTRALKSLALREDATLFMVLLAGFQALLERYSGQDDIVVGSPIAGRTRAESEELIGLFVNSLVLRTDLSGDPSFRELLARVRAVSLGAFAHQELPFERLVQALRPPREMSHHPLFQVMLVLQNAPRTRDVLPGLELSAMGADRTSSQFDLTLFAWESGGELSVTAEYKTALFEESTIARMLEHLERLLAGAVADPARRISEVALLGTEERRHVLEAWNASEAAPPEIATVHGLVEKQIARTPQAVAVEFEGKRLTYAELGHRAREIARRLRAAGIARGDRVGVCLERGPDLVATLLGVLEAGAAYVPLDPTHPAQRLAFILADAEVRALVTQGDLLARLELKSGAVAVLLLERDLASVAAGSEDGELSGAPLSAEDLAYVIYTSGSTGQPKGVEIAHGAVANFLASMHRRPGLRAEDVFLSVTTVTFDISVLEIFGPLSVGARVVLVPAAVAADGLQLEARLTQSRATVMQATPATWRMLLEAGWSGDRRLKILCGGEAWSRRLADELLARCGELWNMYGPTETTIWSAVQRVEAGAAPVSIGEPIANTKLHVLDARGNPQPLGVPGELCIGGAGLARGYWKRPELTSERFVRDPFDAREGARLYRTGDRARRRADGTIEFLGRLDHQVKVQGFRIELGEIESVLATDPRVREVVVVARELGPGDMRLVVYFAGESGAPEPPANELRDRLRERLPEYMVPATFIALDALPQTPNGKVDRAALPAPERLRARSEPGAELPRTPIEKRLAAIWQELLKIEAVSLQDNFFDLGGHSLLAMRVVARLERETHVRLNPSELILQTLGQVAAACERASRGLSNLITTDASSTDEVSRGPSPEAPTRRMGWIDKLLRRGRRHVES